MERRCNSGRSVSEEELGETRSVNEVSKRIMCGCCGSFSAIEAKRSCRVLGRVLFVRCCCFGRVVCFLNDHTGEHVLDACRKRKKAKRTDLQYGGGPIAYENSLPGFYTIPTAFRLPKNSSRHEARCTQPFYNNLALSLEQ